MLRFLPVLLCASALAQDSGFFEAKVRPVLAVQCYQCHGPDKQFGGLRVDSREALLAGGKRGPAVMPGKPDESLLLRALRHQDGLQMPMGGRLKDGEIAAMEQWVKDGAPWPARSVPVSSLPDRYPRQAREHWAFQPVRKPALPAGRDAHVVDRFIRAALEKAGLAPAGQAEKGVLIRRLTYVLTGLPPTAQETAAFVSDPSPRAYERLVDRLLQSPRFGEHWARHWLDVVRYGETRGYEWNYEIIGAWRYRDYLIRAFNEDVPYDQLVREHIAGDLLERPRINAAERINESVIGTAFYRLGEAGHDNCIQFREIATDVVDNQIDTLTKAFQGLTVSCARCHDHKLDPIPAKDYGSLYTILNSSRQVTHTIDTPEVSGDAVRRLKGLKEQIRAELAATWRREAADLPRRLRQWRDSLPKTAAMEDPAFPWLELREARDFSAAAAELGARYAKESAGRERFNRENFTPFDGWQPAGLGLEAAAAGGFAVTGEGGAAINGIYPAGSYTHLVSSRLNGALRSPYLPKDRKYLSVRAMGGMLGARRTVIDNCAIGEDYKVIEGESPAWIKLETFAKEERLPVFVEFVTRWDNPRIPDRPGVLKEPQLKLMESPRSYFGLAGAVLHDVEEPPRATLSHMLPLFAQGAPSDAEDLAGRYAALARQAVDRWAANRADEDDALWLDWLVKQKLLSSEASALVARYREIEAGIEPPRVVEGLADIGHTNKPVPARYLEFLNGGGRRELAANIASASNPLTARVMVNRVWHHVFGRGIVATPDNFGAIGDAPSHPELLDYLAASFTGDGWSVKKLIRLLVTSETFRQSGMASAKAKELDPRNALLHHYPLRRLPAESLRDSLLAISGKLRPAMYGPSTDPHRAEAKDYRRLFSGPLDGAGRRSIYLKVTRMEGNTFLDTFDYPNPMAARGSRDVTNVPLQALTLLNDPFVVGEAEATARRLLAKPAASVDERLGALFQLVLAREPDAAERERFAGLARELASLHKVPAAEAASSLPLWKDLAHAILNLKEFLYIP